MLVRAQDVESVCRKLETYKHLSFDVESTGLNPYDQDELFSIIVGCEDGEYYFNFNTTRDIPDDYKLSSGVFRALQELFNDEAKILFAHNAKFDMAFLEKEGIQIKGTIHCTQSQARLIYNDHLSYSLAACAERIGLKKDDRVDQYIKEHKLFTVTAIEGKKIKETRMHYDQVPWELITEYGCKDAEITYKLGMRQIREIERISNGSQSTLPSLRSLSDHEKRLTKTVSRMERVGIRIDTGYCLRAAYYESSRAEQAKTLLSANTGLEFKNSGKYFSSIFRSDKDRWEYTEKGNPSFDSSVIKKFKNPLAKEVLTYRDAKAKADFYYGFLYHADEKGIIHPNFNPAGTVTGRFSSSEPNFQNLTKAEDEELEEEFVVRRAVIPHPGDILLMVDYDQQEYRLMLDYAGETSLIDKVLGGLDVHEATASMMGVNRDFAKTINFGLLYGQGSQKLSESLAVGLEEAKRLKRLYFSRLPRVEDWINQVTHTAKIRRYVRDWAGRIMHIPDPNFAYTAPNKVIQGGCADVTKIAMNRIDEYLCKERAKMIMTVHDELVISCPMQDAIKVSKRIKEIMESVYPYRKLPLTVSCDWSDRSLADKRKDSL